MTKRKMLILDDDPAVGQTIQWIAESLGFEAEFVTRPEEFFRRLDHPIGSDKNPEIITIDLAMPELDGVEIMRLLAERGCNAKILISSGMGMRVLDAAKRSASEHGLNIVGVVPKPITKEALREACTGAEEPEPARVTAEKRAAKSHDVTEADVCRAIEGEEIVLAYQPKIVCRSGTLDGFEALARWQSPEFGFVPPDVFIPLAEKAGSIDALTHTLFRQSLQWLSRQFPDSELKLSLNLSAKGLVDIQMADVLLDHCRRYGIAPERLVLELTESSAMVDPMLSLDLMTRFRVKGFNLSIDDFGTGYSSMVQLARLPFSELKVDKSFVMQERQTAESRTIIKSVVDLGHSLGLCVTAEGVEDQGTLDYLNTIGCDLAQGYLIAKPMPGNAVSCWAEQRRAQSI
ncbi:MAG: EAL domain-containing response regulator [Terracidiphilus sp.]|nr:EAL domain-containing response regulator [Terracidiphilus sp.]